MSLINKFSIRFTPTNITFKNKLPTKTLYSKGATDSFTTNPIDKNFAISEHHLKKEIDSNPEIKRILKEYNLPVNINYEELNKLKKGHLLTTRVIAAKIYSTLPLELKQQVNLSNLQEAAMYHDYGKVLIPKHILNKTGALTPKEKEIMELHSQLGYELLKNKGVSQDTLNLILYHHQLPDGSGYPKIKGNYKFSLESQILNIADKYSALTENRTYKAPLTKEEALAIIKEDVEKDLISEPIFNALKNSC